MCIALLSDSFNFSRPFSYVKHLNFLDTTEFNLSMPIYINIVRHPVDRVYAWYYYIRAPWYVLKPRPQDIVPMKTRNNTKNSRNVSNVTEGDRTIPNKQWNWKKGRMPSVRFLKTSYIDCIENKNFECLHIKGMTHISSIYCE